MSVLLKGTFLGFLSVLWFTSAQAIGDKEEVQENHSKPSKQKVGRGDRVAIQEGPTTNLYQFKLEDRHHNHDNYIRIHQGHKLYTHTEFAACHLNAAYKFLLEENKPASTDRLKNIIKSFNTTNYHVLNVDRYHDFMWDISTTELCSDLYISSPGAYHLMRAVDHLYSKRRLTLIKQRCYQNDATELERMKTSIDKDYELGAEIWSYLKDSLAPKEYKAYQQKQAELSFKLLSSFKPEPRFRLN